MAENKTETKPEINNPETKQAVEINTPEDLILSLEKKSKKKLAEKVKSVIDGANENAKEQWKTLSRELKNSERKEIIKIIKVEDASIKDKLREDEGLKKYKNVAKVGGISGVAALATAGIMHSTSGLKEAKGMGFFEKLSSAWGNISEIFDNVLKSAESWISSKFPSMASLFGIEVDDESEELETAAGNLKDKAEGIKEGVVAKVEGLKEKMEDAKACKIARSLCRQYYKDQKEPEGEVLVYMTHEKVRGLSFQDLEKNFQQYKNNPEQLFSILGIGGVSENNKKNESKNLLKALEIIYYNKNKFNSLFPNDSSWTQKPVEDIYLRTLPYIKFLDHIRDRKAEIKLADFSFKDAITDSKDNVKEFCGEKKEMLEQLHERFSGLTPNVLNLLHNVYADSPIEHPYNFDARRINDKEQKFMTETLDNYGKNLSNMLINDFSFGDPDMKQGIQEFLSKNKLKKNQLIDFFICSGGNTSIQNMNDWEKAQVTSRLYLVIRGENATFGSKVEANRYLIKTAQYVLGEKECKIPESVKVIMKDAFGVVLESTTKVASELGAMVGAYIVDNKLKSFIVGSGVITTLTFLLKTVPQLRTGLLVFKILEYLLIAAGIGGLYYSISDDGKIKDKEGKHAGDLSALSKAIVEQK